MRTSLCEAFKINDSDLLRGLAVVVVWIQKPAPTKEVLNEQNSAIPNHCPRYGLGYSLSFRSGDSGPGCIFLIGMNMCYLRNEPLVLGESGFSGCFRQFLQ
jgi:hypothetical protein